MPNNETTNKWILDDSQFVSALARLEKLTKSVEKSLDRASKAGDKLGKSGEEVDKGAKKGASGLQTLSNVAIVTGQNMTSLAKTAFGLGKRLFAFAKEGAQFRDLERAFAALGNTKKDLDGLNKVLNKTVDTQTLIKFQNMGKAMGLTSSAIKNMATIAKAASVTVGRDLSESFGRAIETSTKKSIERLDELGLSVVDVKKELKKLGTTLKDASSSQFAQAMTNAAQAILGGVMAIDAQADAFAQMEAKLSDAIGGMSVFAAEVLKDSGALAELNKVGDKFGKFLAENDEAIRRLATEGINVFVSAVDDMERGIESLISGLTFLNDGLDSIDKTFTKLIDGINPVNQVMQLFEGTLNLVGLGSEEVEFSIAKLNQKYKDNAAASASAAKAQVILNSKRKEAIRLLGHHIAGVKTINKLQIKRNAVLDFQSKKRKDAKEAASKQEKSNKGLSSSIRAEKMSVDELSEAYDLFGHVIGPQGVGLGLIELRNQFVRLGKIQADARSATTEAAGSIGSIFGTVTGGAASRTSERLVKAEKESKKSSDKIAKDQARKAMSVKEVWASAIGGIGVTFASTFQEVAAGTANFRDTMANILGGLFDAVAGAIVGLATAEGAWLAGNPIAAAALALGVGVFTSALKGFASRGSGAGAGGGGGNTPVAPRTRDLGRDRANQPAGITLIAEGFGSINDRDIPKLAKLLNRAQAMGAISAR